MFVKYFDVFHVNRALWNGSDYWPPQFVTDRFLLGDLPAVEELSVLEQFLEEAVVNCNYTDGIMALEVEAQDNG